jgi:hypothetical protein
VIWIAAAAAAIGWILALTVLGLLPGRYRRREIQISLKLRSHVFPYLRRRALEAELGVEPDLPHQPDEVLTEICSLADRLTAHERSQVELGDTVNVGVNIAHSDTMPIDTADLPDEE